MLNHTAGSAGQSRHTQAAGVGKSVQDCFISHVLDQPFAQVTRIQIKACIAVHRQVDGIPDVVFFDLRIWLFSEE